MNILKLAAMLTLDGTRFKAGIKEAEASAVKFGKDIQRQFAAAFGATALIAFTRSAFQYVSSLKDMADQSGMTTDEVQRLNAAASKVGLTFNDVTQAERALSKARREAVEGNEELRAMFAKLGFTVDELNSPSMAFSEMITRISDKAKDAGLTTAEWSDMLGRAGGKMREFAEAIREASKEPIVSQETIDKTDKAIERWEAAMRRIKGVIVGELMGGDFWLRQVGIFRPTKKASSEQGTAAPLGPEIGLWEEDKETKARSAANAKKLETEILKEQAALEKQIFEVNLKRLSIDEQRAAKMKRLEETLGYIANLEFNNIPGSEADALRARSDAVGMLSDLLSPQANSASQLETSSLTSVGQLGGGRNVMVGADIAQNTKDIARLAEITNQLLGNIDNKIEKGKTLEVRR